MLNKKNGNNFLLFIFASLSFLVSIVINTNNEFPVLNLSKQETAINVNQNLLKFISLGNKRLISDIIWIKTLLDSDVEHYKKNDFNNWMYYRFVTISELDPLFYENYLWGGMYLGIIKDDLLGAAAIYERGLKIFPNDYKLNFNAAFNYYFELGDFDKGLALMEKIYQHPDAPKSLQFIVNKLRFETSGDFEAAMAYLVHSINTNKDPVLLRKLKGDLYALKAERDLKCLNEGHQKCETKDLNGESYLKKDQKWIAPITFLPYKIHLKK